MYIFFGNRCESWSWTDGILAVLYESQPLQEHERWTEWGWRSVWSPRTIARTRLTSRGASRIWRPVFCFFLFVFCLCAGIELDKLDAEMIKLLAWQRIQQLFPPKAPSAPTPVTATVAAAPKSSSPQPDSETFVNHTFSFVCFFIFLF